MTTTVLGKTRFNIKGQWNSSATYTADDLVMYDGGWYRAKAAVAANVVPTTTASWTNIYDTFHWRGTFNFTNGQTYKVGDIVQFTFASKGTLSSGVNAIDLQRNITETFICIQDITVDTSSNTHKPTNTTYWQQFSWEHKADSTDATTALGTDKVGVYGEDARKCLWFANEGIIYDTHPQYVKGYKNNIDSRYSVHWIDGVGAVRFAGNSSSGGSGWFGQSSGPDTAVLSFVFNDWFASTDNGGSGVLTTPDGKAPRCIQIEYGIDHGTALFNNGEVHAWGYNGNSECGEASTTNRNSPYRVGGTYGEVATQAGGHVLRDVKIIRISQACGNGAANNDSNATHTLGLDSAGQVWAWGYNGYGQCGTGDTTSQVRPYKIAQSYFNNEKVVAIWAFAQNYGVSYAYTENNKLYAWGYNNNGQLGLGNTTNQNRPVQVTTPNFADTAVGTLVKLQFTGNQNSHNCGVLTSTGRVYMTGYNGVGQLCTGGTSNLNAFTQVASGPGSSSDCSNFWMPGGCTQGSTFFLSTSTNKLYGCGYNGIGNIGDTSSTNRSVAVEVFKRVNGANVNMTDVKKIVSTGGNQYYSLLLLTGESRTYGVGYCNYTGLSNDATYAYQLEASNAVSAKEYENNIYAWFPVQSATNFVGKDERGNMRCESIMAVAGTDTATTHYGAHMWRSSDGRLMTSSHENNTMVGGNHAYTWGGNGGWRKARMGDVMQNG